MLAWQQAKKHRNNIENGTNRKFILCTNNENNICEDITYQRLFKVINGHTNPDGEEIEGLGGNLKYYKTNLIEDKVDTHENIQNLIDKCTSLIQIKENCYNLTESNDLYDIISNNNNKIAVIIKNPFIWNHEIDEILDTIEIDKNGLILYTTKSDYSKEGIITKEFPQHIVDQYNRLRKTM